MISWIPMGRLGNFLFMAANCISFALRHGKEFSVPITTNNPFWNPLYLQHLVHPFFNPNDPKIVVQERQFHYNKIEYKDAWDGKNILFNGYFQSWKYFDDYREDILKYFNYPWQESKDVVSVHVRRTDFITHANKHPEVTKEWYEEAMRMFPNKKFFFFSDDINWCVDNFKHRGDCYFSNLGIEEDMICMSGCEHNICSASSYGFWAAYLNKNPDKKCVFPKLWFTPGWDGANTDDILKPEWIKL